MASERVKALLAGRTTYQGRPCPKGHSGLRRADTKRCSECVRIYNRLWWQRNRKKINTKRRAKYETSA